ncbi:uncharacterized protein [Watersipora subatra]|uniref:uncharacterized protein n=1 Tax=Watersipora subatra TaxID=2589382 RepID=UPI00355C9E14
MMRHGQEAVANIACDGFSIVSGPTTTTQEIGSRFTLKCAVADKTSSDTVFWKLKPENTAGTKLLTFNENSNNAPFYEIETGTFNLIVKNATYEDDGMFECEAGANVVSARVYVYDKPESMTLDWEHSINKPDAVKPNEEYKLRCSTIHSHPPATHRYFKDGVELNGSGIVYTYMNDTDTSRGYGDVTSTLPFTPSKDDIDKVKTIRCVADLYNKLNVSHVAFGINSASKFTSFSLFTGMVMLVGILLRA